VLAGREAAGGVGTPLPGAPHPGAEAPKAAAAAPAAGQQPQQRLPPAEGLFKSSSALPVPLGARLVGHNAISIWGSPMSCPAGLMRPALLRSQASAAWVVHDLRSSK
jgi:hypothetical protein